MVGNIKRRPIWSWESSVIVTPDAKRWSRWYGMDRVLVKSLLIIYRVSRLIFRRGRRAGRGWWCRRRQYRLFWTGRPPSLFCRSAFAIGVIARDVRGRREGGGLTAVGLAWRGTLSGRLLLACARRLAKFTRFSGGRWGRCRRLWIFLLLDGRWP